MTYICAGKGSPGRRGGVGVAAELGRRTPHPSTLSVSLLALSHRVFASASAWTPRVFLLPARGLSCEEALAPGRGSGGPFRWPGVRGW